MLDKLDDLAGEAKFRVEQLKCMYSMLYNMQRAYFPSSKLVPVSVLRSYCVFTALCWCLWFGK